MTNCKAKAAVWPTTLSVCSIFFLVESQAKPIDELRPSFPHRVAQFVRVAQNTAQLQAYDNHDLTGPTLFTLPNVDLQQCSELCRSNNKCRAYSFDKRYKQCFLKSAIGSLRFEPTSVAGVSGSLPPKSNAPWETLRLHYQSAYGDALRSEKAGAYAQCERTCVSEQACVAFTYADEPKACTLLRTVGGYVSDRDTESGIKRQTPASNTATNRDQFQSPAGLPEVFAKIRTDYVEKPDDSGLIESAIKGMVERIDSYSRYFPPNEFRNMQEQTHGEFGGVGLDVTMEDGLIRVVAPIAETPAAKAGLLPDDIITYIDDNAVQGLTLNQAVEKLRGPVNSKIKLRVVRGSEAPKDFTLSRDVIRARSVRSQLEGDNVGYIRITRFGERTSEDLRSAISDLASQAGNKLQGFILDLRNNPGSSDRAMPNSLGQAISVSDAFLEKGEIVTIRGRNPEETQRFDARPGDLTNGRPIVVLINGGSAEASEIVAGALQDHKRATIVGTRSFGKGSMQTLIPLTSTGGALWLTTARYFTPSGRSVSRGISPDTEVLQHVPEQIKARANESDGDVQGGSQTYVPPDAKDDKALKFAVDLIRSIKKNPAYPSK